MAPADALAAAEEIRAVGKCVADLPAELANLVRLRYVDALTTRGIAQAAKMPEATVRSRLAEAVKALEKCLKSKGFVKS